MPMWCVSPRFRATTTAPHGGSRGAGDRARSLPLAPRASWTSRQACDSNFPRSPSSARMGIGNKIRNRNWKLWFYITLVNIYIIIYICWKRFYLPPMVIMWLKQCHVYHPPVINNFYRCYGYHSLKWVVHDIGVLPTLLEQVWTGSPMLIIGYNRIIKANWAAEAVE